MTWTKLSDDFTDRPELLEISRSARMLLIELIVYSNRMLTDGRIAAGAVRRLTDSTDPETELLELESAGWVTLVENGRAYQVDWSDQESASDVRDRQDATKERKRRSRKHLAGDHSLCLPGARCRALVTHPVTRDKTRGSQSGSHSPVLPVPAQSRDGGQTRLRCANGSPIAPDGTCCGRTHLTAESA
ncbi:hypothetical protein EFL95_09070 [Nocardioides marmorisolisilvae]|uniref:Uncharacterized protein n=1 Tax=Nocardioides marmorisolisilvae TaxID=1542737 RepID=A0A3N0DU98_9ACTN|nr:hypothetical protein EFL95_09070 [Nocardioides marmorisolisilvae]